MFYSQLDDKHPNSKLQAPENSQTPNPKGNRVDSYFYTFSVRSVSVANSDQAEGCSLRKPLQSLFRILEGFDIHATVHCHRFTESLWIKHGFTKDVGEGRTSGYSPTLIADGHFRRVVTKVESLDHFGLSDERPAINE